MSTYYLDAINGNDYHAGGESTPWRTLDHALPLLLNGDTCYLKTGVYFLISDVLNGQLEVDSLGFVLSRYKNQAAVITNPNNKTCSIHDPGGFALTVTLFGLVFKSMQMPLITHTSDAFGNLTVASVDTVFKACNADCVLSSSGSNTPAVTYDRCATDSTMFDFITGSPSIDNCTTERIIDANGVVTLDPADFDSLIGASFMAVSPADGDWGQAIGPYLANNTAWSDDAGYGAGRPNISSTTISVLSGASARVISAVFDLGNVGTHISGFGFSFTGVGPTIDYRYSDTIFTATAVSPTWNSYTPNSALNFNTRYLQLRLTILA